MPGVKSKDPKKHGCPPDKDGDGIFDTPDNCRSVINPEQHDLDNDGYGDACDTDDNADAWVDTWRPGGGGGCSSTPGASWVFLLLMQAYLLKRRRRSRW